MNNRSTIMGFVLIFLIMIGYIYLTTPSKEEILKRKLAEDSAQRALQPPVDSARLKVAKSGDSVSSNGKPSDLKSQVVDTLKNRRNELRDQLGAFSVSATGKSETVTIENDLLKIKVSTLGGKVDYVELKKYKTWEKKPLVLVNKDSVRFGLTFYSNNRIINTNQLYFKPVWIKKSQSNDTSRSVIGKDSLQLAMRLYASPSDTILNPNKYIEFLYTLHGDGYMLGFKINFVGMGDLIVPFFGDLKLGWADNIKRQEKSLKMEKQNTALYYKFVNDEVKSITDTKEKDETVGGDVQWISIKQQFFASTIVASKFFKNPTVKTINGPEFGDKVKSISVEVGVPYNPVETKSISMSMYYGPLKYYGLKSYKIDLEEQIPLGWWKYFPLLAWINIYAVIPIFTLLGNWGWNYGIVILVLTILLKTVLFPIAYKTYKSSAKMRVLKPDIDELNKKFPKKEDAMKKQQATMELYKRAGVNPMAGCIPLLLQMPILIAMFRFFPSSIELRQQAFLWAKDLSSYDSIWTFPGGFSIPMYGDHVSLFALLMTISSIFYTRINDQMMGSQQSQMPGMKTMMYMMPVMFLVWFNDYSSGLSYYYLLANLLTFAQIYIIRSTIDEKSLHAQIQANKKKPIKKSGFQKRLEDMAKKQGRR